MPATLDALETFLTTALGKGVIRALDTPNFIANRIGVFSILAACTTPQAFGLGFDEVDALTGPRSAGRRARPTAPATSSGSTPRARHRHDAVRHPAGRSVARVLQRAGGWPR
jgi:3-hydroxyacyl-CoA dehydrogenase